MEALMNDVRLVHASSHLLDFQYIIEGVVLRRETAAKIPFGTDLDLARVDRKSDVLERLWGDRPLAAPEGKAEANARALRPVHPLQSPQRNNARWNVTPAIVVSSME